MVFSSHFLSLPLTSSHFLSLPLTSSHFLSLPLTSSPFLSLPLPSPNVPIRHSTTIRAIGLVTTRRPPSRQSSPRYFSVPRNYLCIAGAVLLSLCPLGFARIPLRALASFMLEAANVGAVRTPLP